MSPHSLDPRNVRRYRRRGRIGLAMSLAAIPITLAGLINRDLIAGSAAGVALTGPVDTLWLLGYFAGSILTIAGLLWRPIPRPELEALGLWLLLGAMLTNGFAILAVRGPVAGGLSALGLFALAWVMHARIGDLHDAAHSERRHTESDDYPGPNLRRP